MRSSGESPQRAPALGGLLLTLGFLITAAGLVLVTGSWSTDSVTENGATAGADEPARLTDWAASPQVPPADGRTERGERSDAADEQQAPMPVGIRIPSIEVDAEMDALGLRDDGSIEVPTDFARTGWWADGPEPGERGPAVVLGHVDSRSGPAVFFSLTELQPGDEVIIDRVDGSSVAYRVDRIEQHAKDEFPTEAVYGATDDPQLRLVTCGGDFDQSERSYRDNVVVFATRA